MNQYEIVYIFRSTLAPEELESKLQNFHAQLTRNAGQVSAVEHWGKRQLAYPIEKERNGNYVVAQFETEPASLPDFERLLKLDDQILRYLIVLSEGELPIPPSMRREKEDRPASTHGAAAPAPPAEAEREPDEGGEPEGDEGPQEPEGESDAAGDLGADDEAGQEAGITAEEDEAGDAEEAEGRSSSDG